MPFDASPVELDASPVELDASPTPVEIEAEIYQLLKEARDILSKPKSWTGGSFEDQKGRVCLVGALLKAEGRPRLSAAPSRKTLKCLAVLGFRDMTAAVKWNDSLFWFGRRRVVHRLNRAIGRR